MEYTNPKHAKCPPDPGSAPNGWRLQPTPPTMGRPNVTQIHEAADLLLAGMVQYQLELLLSLDTITREKNNERSTLDLALGTEGIAFRVATCQVIDTFSGSDHLPIETTIQLETTAQTDRECLGTVTSDRNIYYGPQLTPMRALVG
jgi:hypothetical protein